MPKRPNPTTRIVVTLPRDLHAAAVKASKADERSLAATVRILLRRYVEGSGAPS